VSDKNKKLIKIIKNSKKKNENSIKKKKKSSESEPDTVYSTPKTSTPFMCSHGTDRRVTFAVALSNGGNVQSSVHGEACMKGVEVFGVEYTVSGSDVREYFLGRYNIGILKL
jgi:hypothetical protein